MPLIAYNAAGEVVQTLDFFAPHSEGRAGTVDLERYEAEGGRLRHILNASNAMGSGTWPEHLGEAVHDFRVELEGKRIVRLVHHRSKHVRHRHEIEAAIAKRHGEAMDRLRKEAKVRKDVQVALDGGSDVLVDVSDLLGSPGHPLELDEHGRTRVKRDAKR